MFDKKKKHFWQLAILFGTITILSLTASFGYGQNRQQSSMMGSSMADMMGMHLGNATIADLISQQDQMDAPPASNNTANHHGGEAGFLKSIHQLTTGSILILLPFILAGTVFLAIVWLK